VSIPHPPPSVLRATRWVPIRVDLQVTGELGLVAEALAAVPASVGLLTRVDALVLDQV